MSPAEPKTSLPRPPVYRVLLAEAGMLVLATLGAWTLDAIVARSILCGGLVYLAPQVWFAWRAFRFSGASSARLVVQGFYRGEAGKFLLTSLAFVAVFVMVRPLNAVAFFGAFVALSVVNPLLLSRLKGV
jgi:ATP synthase protein I